MISFHKLEINLMLVVTFFTFSVQLNVQNLYDPVVGIPSLGWLRGSIGSTKWTNRSFYQFLGIKYAEAPSGMRRFKPPVPVKPWYGIRSAIQMGQSCPQGNRISSNPTIDIEDCLYLNVYTPKIPSSRNNIEIHYPVLVYIHGGTFSSGSNREFPPSYLLEHDIVLIVPNYRLNALGFLSTQTAEIPGNAGVLDVLFVLKWVKQNIKYFGGNENKITVMGQSSGAAMVSSLLLSPLVPENLFQQMIIHSGSVFAPWTYALDPVAYARDIARRAKIPENSTIHEINDAFMKMDIYDLIKAANEHFNNGRIKGSNRVGSRSLTVGGPSLYLPYSPEKLIQMGYYKKNIKLITGVVQNEGSFLTATLYDKLKSLNFLNNPWFMRNLFLPIAVNLLGVKDNKKSEVFDLVKNIFGTQIANNAVNFLDYASGFSELAGTVGFKEPVLQLAQVNTLFNPCRTFLYSFDYHGKHSRFGYEKDVSRYPFDGGVSHSDDLIYLFPYPEKVAHLNPADTEMAKNFVELWTSFVKTGIPQLKSKPAFQWPVMTSFWGPYLHINKIFDLGDDFTDEFTIGLKNFDEYLNEYSNEWVTNCTELNFNKG